MPRCEVFDKLEQVPSLCHCVAVSVIVRIGLDEFVRIVILVTCYKWNTRKPLEF